MRWALFVVAVTMVACGGVVGQDPGAGDGGDDAATAFQPYCDVPVGDAGAVQGFQCGAQGIDWTWVDSLGAHDCAEPCVELSACSIAGAPGVCHSGR